jgi:hypothetical protein
MVMIVESEERSPVPPFQNTPAAGSADLVDPVFRLQQERAGHVRLFSHNPHVPPAPTNALNLAKGWSRIIIRVA